MLNLKNDLLENLEHHSLLFLGDRDILEERILKELLEKFNIKKTANPDFTYFKGEFLSTNELRNILSIASLKSFSNNKKIFLISVLNILTESQNVFLKALEEAPPNVVFIIICPQNIFIETFLSRVKMTDLREASEGLDLLSKTILEKLNFVSKITKEIGDEKKSKDEALKFVNLIENEIIKNVGLKLGKDYLLACSLAKDRLSKKGAMLKMILENLVLQIS